MPVGAKNMNVVFTPNTWGILFERKKTGKKFHLVAFIIRLLQKKKLSGRWRFLLISKKKS